MRWMQLARHMMSVTAGMDHRVNVTRNLCAAFRGKSIHTRKKAGMQGHYLII
ncbi:hypothetical protein [Virgibacillus oceani]|uniref:hypothetical protein n=1 Tax=Virgibacillus oceani TaxID=1479511 RepID=UPI0035715C31